MIPIFVNDVPIACINRVATTYHVPAAVILSVMIKENSRNGQAVKNKNGTYDYGVFQINDVWLPKIAAYGYTKHDLQYHPCRNVEVAAWIIGRNMAEGQSVWKGIANYHSKTPVYNQPYRHRIQAIFQALSKVIYV